MEEKGYSESREESLCAMYFGVSCTFFALINKFSTQVLNEQRCSETRDKILQETAHMLGLLLLWRRIQETEQEKRIEKQELIHKLEEAKKEIMELKLTRSEDAKANEKVASIYAAQEQSWFIERRKLRNQVSSLVNDLRILDKRKNETISELSRKVGELEDGVKVFEEEEKKRIELEEKLRSNEVVLEELKEKNKVEAQEHSCEVLKHKKAFIELVSNQRQLEAELGRASRQVEAAKQRLEYLFDEKEEAVLMVEELSVEIERMGKESEKKDKILSAMMRKIQLDSPEKQMNAKDFKFYRPKKKLGERRSEKFGSFPASRSERHTLRSFLSRQVSSRLLEVFPDDDDDDDNNNNNNVGRNLKSEQCEAFFDDLDDTEVKKENEDHYNPYSEQGFPEECTDQFHEGTRLDEWFHAEAEKYHTSVKQQHQRELEDLEEKIRVKDEKLEAYHWKLVNAEVESKRLQSKVEVLNQELFQLQDNNLRLESLSVEREREIKALKDQINGIQWNSLNAQKSRKHSSKREFLVDNDITGYMSKLNKITKKKTGEKEQKSENKEEGNEPEFVSKDTSSTSFSSVEEVEGSTTEGLNKMNNASPWKVDLHALGVTYKIKRLNQQLLMLDRLTGKQESNEFKNFSVLLSLLKKQVGRYQSLHEKTDNLSKQMDEKNLNVKRGTSKRAKEETRNLEHFLEETFQLQRFIVATGQKLMEVQSKISSGFVDGIASEFEGVANFDMKRFGDTMQSLFKDVQRGLEVRISRIIGDLEGTLAYDGIHFLK